jgi:ATP-dependent helicase/nuclease subunit A
VILLRSVAGWAGIFEDRFNREGIPFYYDGGKGFYETLEVKIILNLLKLIDNTRQDIPLLSVMRSPLGNFTTEELLEIRLSHPEEKYFTQALNKYIRSACEGGEASDLAQRLKSFMDKIYDWNYRSRYVHGSPMRIFKAQPPVYLPAMRAVFFLFKILHPCYFAYFCVCFFLSV